MPEPQTRTVQPDPEPPPEPTGEWKGPPAEVKDPDAPTVTRTVASTPGPQHPERRTDSDDTERDRPATEAELPQIPGFLVQAEIGRGGMGVVYRAVHLEMAKTVALKVVYTLGRDPEMVRARFAREVQALARLEHPNVVPIYHAGQWHGFPYFTMKFVPGGALAKQLGRFHGNPTASARLVAKVARAVQALHDHKVIHRDLKPLNILLGDSDEPLVADFGLAKWLDDDPTTAVAADYPLSGTGVPMGTRQYMAPEQTRGERTDLPEAPDIWALGVTLYELLTGLRPFPDDGRSDLAKRICEEPAPPLPDSVPAELAAVVGHCLAKRPGDRYPSAAAVADDLERWLAGQPVVAPLTSPAPPVEPVSEPKPRRRRPWLVALALVGLTALIAIVASVFPGRPDAPKKSVGDRLRDREEVTLIEEGSPLVPVVPVLPGGVLTTDRNGFCLLNALTSHYVELVGEPLPLPVRLEGEVALLAAKPGLGHGGFYAGRQVVSLPDGPRHALWKMGTIAWDPVEEGGQFLPSERGLLELTLVHEPDRSFASLQVDYRHSFIDRRTRQGADPLPPLWQPISVTIGEATLEARWRGTPLHAVDPLKKLRDHCKKSDLGRNPFPAALGNGIGVFAVDAEVVFRNVRLVPLRP